jgi:uncharacterized membrane protein (DUF485 family)
MATVTYPRIQGNRDRLRIFTNKAKAISFPITRSLSKHYLAIMGLASFDTAGFIHSPFVGCIVTGASLLLLEWKVSE